MRNFINLIENVNVDEAVLPTSVKTKPSDLSMPSMNTIEPHRARDLASRASQEMILPPEVHGQMMDLPADDEITNAQAYANAGYGTDAPSTEMHIPVTPETLPSIISNEVANSMGEEMHFDWMMIKQLPGYLQAGIRSLGRQVFRQWTNTPIEDIQILSTITADQTSVKYMAAWITKFGHKIDESTLTFHQMGGIEAHCTIWTYEGMDFLIQKDFSGYYIYAFPAANRQMTDTTDADAPQLGGRPTRMDALPRPARRLPRY